MYHTDTDINSNFISKGVEIKSLLNSIDIQPLLEYRPELALNVSLFETDGVSSILYLLYLEEFFQIDVTEEMITHFSNLQQILSAAKFSGDFSSGISGLGWLLNHISELTLNNFYPSETKDLIVNLSYKYFSQKFEEHDLDYLYGSLGAGFFLLDQKNQAYHDSVLERVLTKNKCKTQFFICNNLGLAHGVPSRIIFICKLLDKYPKHPILVQILTTLIEHLVKFKKYDQHGTYYPPNSSSEKRTNLAWCYGNFGVGISLFKAAIHLNCDQLKNEAMRLFNEAIVSRDIFKSAIKDAGICHGFSACALIFNRMYLNTNVPSYREEAEYWCRCSLEYLMNFKSVTEYKCTSTSGNEQFLDNSLLTGINGVALSIISIYSSKNYTWDKSLMLY